MLLKAFLLMLIAILAQASPRFLGCLFLDRPVVVSCLAGLALGDLHTGLVMGGTLELIWMGVMYIGISVPSDVATGAIVGTAVAIFSSQSIDSAMAVSLPTGILSAYIVLGISVLMAFIVQKADKYAEGGHIDAVNRIHIFCGALRCLLMGLLVFLIIFFGENALQSFVKIIPENVLSGLNATAGMLPAVGFAMMLNIMWDKAYLPYYFIGFVFAMVLSMNITAIAVIGLSVAAIKYYDRKTDAIQAETGTSNSPPPNPEVITPHSGSLSKKEFNQLFWRSMMFSASTNPQRWQALGFLYTISPILKKLYRGQTTRMAAACKRHLELVNTNEFVAPFIVGAAVALEQTNSKNKNDALGSMISTAKIALMGPITAIGDTVFWGTLRIIAAGIGAQLCLQGNPLGPIMFLLIFNIPAQFTRYFMLRAGYKAGDNILQGINADNPLTRLTDCAYVLGLMVSGGMTASFVTVKTRLSFTIEATSMTLQSILDSIFPGILSLGITFLCTYLIRRKNVMPQYLLFLILVIGLAGGLLGVL
jgi:PTS system mannose-specific IID component